MRPRSPHALLATMATAVAVALAGCSAQASSASANSVAPSLPAAAGTESIAGEESTFGESTGLWKIPREVQVAYAKAVCTAPASEFGFDGTFDDATRTCATRNDMTSDVAFLMRNLLAKDSTQMQQTVDQMLEQSGATVPDCPRPGVSGDAKNAAVTNECVIAAMQALTAYLND
jgi:hypothetical protein